MLGYQTRACKQIGIYLGKEKKKKRKEKKKKQISK